MTAPPRPHATRPYGARILGMLGVAVPALFLTGCGVPATLSYAARQSPSLARPGMHPAPTMWLVGTVAAPGEGHSASGTPIAWLATASGVWAAATGAHGGRRVSIWYAPWPAGSAPVRFGPLPLVMLPVSVGPRQFPVLLGSPTPTSVLVGVESTAGPEADTVAEVWLATAHGALRLADLLPPGTRPAFVRGETVAVAGSGLVVLGVGARSGPPGPYVPRFTEVVRIGVARGRTVALQTCRLAIPIPPATLWPVPGPASGPRWLLHVSGAVRVTLSLLSACPPASAGPSTRTNPGRILLRLPRDTLLLWPARTAQGRPHLTGWVTLQGSTLAGWRHLADGQAALAWRLVAPDSLVVPTCGPLALLGQSSGRWLPVDLTTGALGPALPAGTLLSAQAGAVLVAHGRTVVYARVRSRPAAAR